MFTRQEFQTMASWLGKIQRFNSENKDKYIISFDYYNPYWDAPVQILFYKVVGDYRSLIVRVMHDRTTGIGEINDLLNLIVKHKVNFDNINYSNWKEYVENSKEN